MCFHNVLVAYAANIFAVPAVSITFGASRTCHFVGPPLKLDFGASCKYKLGAFCKSRFLGPPSSMDFGVSCNSAFWGPPENMNLGAFYKSGFGGLA